MRQRVAGKASDVTMDPESPGEGNARVRRMLADAAHPHAPIVLAQPGRSAQEAATALGVALGQIAKSVVFRRSADGAAVLVVASGDKRVDERKAADLVGSVSRAVFFFVKEST